MRSGWMLRAVAPGLRAGRVPTILLATAVFPLPGLGVFWIFVTLYAAVGEDALYWLPGATAVTTAACLPPGAMALVAYRRGMSLPRAIV